MLCPLKKYTYPGNYPEWQYTEFGECEKEKCAWWNSWNRGEEKGGNCAILSIAGRLDDMLISGLPAKRVYTCTVCGKQGFWGQRDWAWYGSFDLLDAVPDELIYTCSQKCQDVVDEKLKSGAWELPMINRRGQITRERKGY